MNPRELRRNAENEQKALNRILDNQRLLNKKISDIIAIRNNQFSFSNHMERREDFANEIVDLDTKNFTEVNLKKLSK